MLTSPPKPSTASDMLCPLPMSKTGMIVSIWSEGSGSSAGTSRGPVQESARGVDAGLVVGAGEGATVLSGREVPSVVGHDVFIVGVRAGDGGGDDGRSEGVLTAVCRDAAGRLVGVTTVSPARLQDNKTSMPRPSDIKSYNLYSPVDRVCICFLQAYRAASQTIYAKWGHKSDCL